MASILQHQVESSVNNLYLKMQKHAQIIMRLSMEVEKLSKENDELAELVMKNKIIIKKLVENQNSDIIRSNMKNSSNDIISSNNTNNELSKSIDIDET
jgi:hypothetical protein